MPPDSLAEADSLVVVFSGAGASAVAVVVAAPFSPFPSEPELLVAVVRVRGVRCDISVLLNAAPPIQEGAQLYTFSSVRSSCRRVVNLMKTFVDESGTGVSSVNAGTN